MKIIDIHTHTNFSDGELSPSQLLTEAEKMGLSVFSVSDHNTVEAYTAIRQHPKRAILQERLPPSA